MADKHEHIDLTTMRDVERLLAETPFVTLDDLAGVGGLEKLSASLQKGAAPRQDAVGSSEGLAPLPRRR
jgi:hypothetical protein